MQIPAVSQNIYCNGAHFSRCINIKTRDAPSCFIVIFFEYGNITGIHRQTSVFTRISQYAYCWHR